jgi:N6-adenosine-specific RNA methylase IME4
MFPARGPKAKGWGDLLQKLCIEERTALRYMQLAGYVDEISDNVSETIPTYAQAGIIKTPQDWPAPATWTPQLSEREILTKASEIRARQNEERRQERIARIAEISMGNRSLELPSKFPILLADPPWRYDFQLSEDRKIENHYPTMPVEDICALPIGDVVTDDALLFLWATNPLLLDALAVIEAWGFRYVTNLVWVKDKLGMGHRVRARHELLLLAVRGSFPCPAPADMPGSVIEAPRTTHSAKPAEAAELIERQYPTLAKLELFARTAREGWSAWGNQAPEGQAA